MENLTDEEKKIIDAAKAILEKSMRIDPVQFSSPGVVKDYLSCQIGLSEREVFFVMYLDTQNKLIHAQDEFRGTIDAAAVYPREVVKSALKYNAAAVIIAHNHPSGEVEPSQADKDITQRLKKALDIVDVRILDHFIVSGTRSTSFAERGILEKNPSPYLDLASETKKAAIYSTNPIKALSSTKQVKIK